MRVPVTYAIAGGAVLAALAWVYFKGTKGVGSTLVAGAVDLADGVISEAVFTAGEVVGVPRTNQTECGRAKAEGRTWDASFACPAGDFLKYLWD